ncbi:MAG: bifunctional metallophosphatase/5'-nucleotidase [Lachnospiraceae bacterium]|nr:bifunctional metallophosphatase/5'-nucleotidase [Lachnospiraceae bacterium]
MYNYCSIIILELQVEFKSWRLEYIMYINIYHTNDIHCEFDTFRKIAAYLKKHKTENDFYFDSGDYTDLKSIVVQADRGYSVMELMRACKLDAMCLGNNEVDLGNEAIVNLCEKGFPMISVNVTDNWNETISAIQSSMILERGNKRFLIIGTSPYYSDKLQPSSYNVFFEMGNLKTQEPIEEIKKEIEKQKGNYDFCILLSHSGLLVDEWMLEQLPQVDLCLGGHSHSVKAENGYSQSGKMGEKLGRVTLQLTEEGIGEVESVQIELAEDYDEEFDAFYDQKLKKADDILSKPLKICRELIFDPFKECELINFICDALKKEFESDFAIMHAGIAEDALKKPVSQKSIIENFPSKLNPTIFTISGKSLKEAIKLSFDEEYIRGNGRGPGFRGHVLGTLGFSSNVRIGKDSLYITIDGQLLEDEKEYRIVSDDYLQRGSGYPSLKVDDDQAVFDKRFIRDIVRENLEDEELFEQAKVCRIWKC